ncbi:DUF6514 family protein [Acetivibrio cellulolyticus]|uniref:DUF6514 family protein n=1 Tax=Acetivibrio cellulolyticus TaxID=35830 RepID=UPI0001E2D8F1|nr:DUF6514 family protein [Acetivibrio cellulolyticus]
MISKYLEKRVELDLCELMRTSSKIQLEYYLVESEYDQRYGYREDKAYGVEISKKERDSYAESETVTNLSNSKEKTQGILSILARNTVTPVQLLFVLDELIEL